MIANKKRLDFSMLVLSVQVDIDGRYADKTTSVADESIAKFVRNMFNDVLLEAVLEESRVIAVVAVKVSDFTMDLRNSCLSEN